MWYLNFCAATLAQSTLAHRAKLNRRRRTWAQTCPFELPPSIRLQRRRESNWRRGRRRDTHFRGPTRVPRGTWVRQYEGWLSYWVGGWRTVREIWYRRHAAVCRRDGFRFSFSANVTIAGMINLLLLVSLLSDIDSMAFLSGLGIQRCDELKTWWIWSKCDWEHNVEQFSTNQLDYSECWCKTKVIVFRWPLKKCFTGYT